MPLSSNFQRSSNVFVSGAAGGRASQGAFNSSASQRQKRSRESPVLQHEVVQKPRFETSPCRVVPCDTEKTGMTPFPSNLLTPTHSFEGNEEDQQQPSPYVSSSSCVTHVPMAIRVVDVGSGREQRGTIMVCAAAHALFGDGRGSGGLNEECDVQLEPRVRVAASALCESALRLVTGDALDVHTVRSQVRRLVMKGRDILKASVDEELEILWTPEGVALFFCSM